MKYTYGTASHLFLLLSSSTLSKSKTGFATCCTQQVDRKSFRVPDESAFKHFLPPSKIKDLNGLFYFAGEQGLEPRLHAPKARVLPLDDSPMYLTFARILEKSNKFKVKFINGNLQPYYLNKEVYYDKHEKTYKNRFHFV